MRNSLTIALAASAVISLASVSAQAQLLPHAPVVDRLPNGLTVITLPYDSPGIAAYFTLVRTGARDEVERGHSGFAHLFEHMMFRGTQSVSATEYEHRMQALSADNNAFTTEDFTLYTITLPSTSLAGLVPVEADRFQHLAYTEPVFQTETRAVLGEYNKNSSSPLLPMSEALSEIAFTRHTYGHTTLGYLADIQAMPGYYTYSQNFFRRFYTPDNCTVIVAGDVQRDQVLALIREHYGHWTGHRDNPRIAPEPEQRAPRTRAIAWEAPTPARMLIGYRIPAFNGATNDTAALEVVHALAFSESSDLYQRLVAREQKLLGLESWARDYHRDPQLFVVEAKLHAGTTFEETQQAVSDELARIGRGDYPPERIASVISNLRYAMPMGVQTPSDAAELLARFIALTGDPNSLEQYHQRLSSVTPADVVRVAQTYLTDAHRSTVTLIEAAHAAPGAVRMGPNAASRSTPAAATTAPAAAPRARPRPAARPATARPARPR